MKRAWVKALSLIEQLSKRVVPGYVALDRGHEVLACRARSLEPHTRINRVFRVPSVELRFEGYIEAAFELGTCRVPVMRG